GGHRAGRSAPGRRGGSHACSQCPITRGRAGQEGGPGGSECAVPQMRTTNAGSTLDPMSFSAHHLNVHTIRGTTHVTVSGDLDLHTRQQTAAVLDELDNCEADDVIVDLQDLGFMDSTGVSALLTLAH